MQNVPHGEQPLVDAELGNFTSRAHSAVDVVVRDALEPRALGGDCLVALGGQVDCSTRVTAQPPPSAAETGSDGQRREGQQGAVPVSDPEQSALLLVCELHELRHHEQLGAALTQVPRARLQISEVGLSPIQPAMDFRVEVAPEDAAAADREHAEEGDVAVGGAQTEAAVDQDAYRREDAEHHVRLEPAGDGPQEAHRLDALAQRVQQLHQDHHSADDPDGISETGPRAQIRGDGKLRAEQQDEPGGGEQQPVGRESCASLSLLHGVLDLRVFLRSMAEAKSSGGDVGARFLSFLCPSQVFVGLREQAPLLGAAAARRQSRRHAARHVLERTRRVRPVRVRAALRDQLRGPYVAVIECRCWSDVGNGCGWGERRGRRGRRRSESKSRRQRDERTRHEPVEVAR